MMDISVTINTGTTVIDRLSHFSNPGSSVWDYTLSKTTNIRAGIIRAGWDGSSSVEFTEQSLADIGDTSDIVFSVIQSGSEINLQAVSDSDGWTLEATRRDISRGHSTGNLIYSPYCNWVDYTPTSSTETTNYEDDNIKLYAKVGYSWRSTVITDSNIVLDMGSSQSLDAIFIDRCNFDTVTIQGNATDTWGSPSYEDLAIPLDRDPERGVYSLYHSLTAFNYQYLRILIPAQTPTDDASYFEITRVALIGTETEISENHTFHSSQVDSPVEENDFGEMVGLSSFNQWVGWLEFETIQSGYLDEIYDIARFQGNQLIMIFLNNGDTSQAYICRRRGAVKVSRKSAIHFDAGTFEFVEAIT